MKQRAKTFGMVQHDPEGIHPIRISTVHTRKGAGFWSMSVKNAVRLRAQLDAAIERARPQPSPGGETGT